MRRIALALAIAGLVALPGQVARADDDSGPDVCTSYAARSAMPSLYQSYQFSPQGYGGQGYAPLTYPFSVGPYGNAAYFGGAGVPFGSAPAFGPLGPGLTANNIFTQVIQPTGLALNQPANFGTLVGLAGLQQGELGTLNGRYGNSALYQTASATWAGAYATQAASAFTILQALCANQGASGSSSISSMGMGGMGMMQPSMMQPSMMQPSMMQPSMMQPSMMQPSMMSPSMMQPSMMPMQSTSSGQ
jgi:hypothetical protein